MFFSSVLGLLAKAKGSISSYLFRSVFHLALSLAALRLMLGCLLGSALFLLILFNSHFLLLLKLIRKQIIQPFVVSACEKQTILK